MTLPEGAIVLFMTLRRMNFGFFIIFYPDDYLGLHFHLGLEVVDDLFDELESAPA